MTEPFGICEAPDADIFSSGTRSFAGNQLSLFEVKSSLPNGFRYRPDPPR